MSFGPFSETHMYVCISSYVGGCLVTMGMLILLVYTTVYTVYLAVILIWRFDGFGFDRQI